MFNEKLKYLVKYNNKKKSLSLIEYIIIDYFFYLNYLSFIHQ